MQPRDDRWLPYLSGYGKKTKFLKRLEKHRKELLDKVHEGERQIECLDYLVFQIGRCSFFHDER